ncbi:hypothetical protein ACTBW4_01205 [Roseovarius pacificus]
MSTLIHQIDEFLTRTGLSEHRAGILLANNGRLIPRLRQGRRIWPETEQRIRDALKRETERRSDCRADEV